MNINISGEVVRTSQLPKRIIGLGDYLVALNSSPLETSTVLVSDFVSFLNTQFATSLASLTDVSINTPLPGQALVFNGSYWVNQNLVSSLAGLSDVTIASLNPNQLLRYDGTSWKNWTPTFYSLPAGGTTLQYIDGTGALQTFPTALPTGTVRHQVKAGVPITKGQAVYVTSADGTNMIVGLASNASEATSSKTMGLLDATVSTNGFANVVTEGLLTGLDTTGANAAGDPVWLGTNGNLIYGLVNKPYAPNHLVFIGIVTRRNANNGEIFVKVQNGFELDELHNVDARNPSNNDGIFYNSTTQLWEHKQISAVAPTPTLAQVTTAGNTTTNSIGIGTTGPVDFNLVVEGIMQVRNAASSFTGLRIDSASIRKRDTGTFSLGTNDTTSFNIFAPTNNIGINTTTDSGYKLDVNGSTRIKGTGTTNATTALLVQNLDATNMLSLTDNGTLTLNAFQQAPTSFIVNRTNTTMGGSFNGATLGTLITINDTVANSNGSKSTVLINSTGSSVNNAVEIYGGVGIGIAPYGASFFVAYATTVYNTNRTLAASTFGLSSRSSISTYDAGNGGGISFWGDDRAQGLGNTAFAGIRGIKENSTYVNSLGNLAFYVQASSASLQTETTFIETARFTSGGNLLINTTTNAGYKLDVNGTGRFSNTLTIATTATGTSPSNSILITTADGGNGGRITWGDSNTSILRYSNSLYFREYTGNFVFESTNSSTILFAVRPSNTTVSSGKFITNGSTTAASALAQGVYFNNTLVAAANNDVLVGLDINPTFTNGAFTGTRNIVSRFLAGTVSGSNGAQIAIRQTDGTGMGAVIGTQGGGWNALGFWGMDRFPLNAPDLRIFSTGVVRTGGNFIVDGNLLINTTTDAGYRLDVNGTARISGQLDIAPGVSILQITAVTQVNSRIIQFNTNGSAGAYSGGYEFRSGFNSGYGANTALRIWSNSTTNSRVGIGNLSEGDLQGGGSHLYINNSISGGRNAGIRISPTAAATSQYNGIQFDYANKDSNGGAFLGSQHNPLTNGYDMDLVVLTTSTAPNSYAETARFIGKYNSFFIGTDKTLAQVSAKLQVESTTQGFLAPRLTTAQILLITSPAEGLQVYNTDLKTICFYNGTAWQRVTSTAM